METNENVLAGIDVARALRDEMYRAELTEAQRAALPKVIAEDELSDEQLENVAGGNNTSGPNGCPITSVY